MRLFANFPPTNQQAMRMKSKFYLLIALGFVGLLSYPNGKAYGQEVQKYTKYVNPFIGTQFFGHTYPGASLPFAMVHVSPDCNTTGWTYAAGYTYSDNYIIGFSHTHFSGTGMTAGGDILFQPTVTDKIKVVPGSDANPDNGYRSKFDHENEKASPGYYSVVLKDYNVNVELTASKRVAFHRYTFPESKNANIIIDLGHQIGSSVGNGPSEISILNNSQIAVSYTH